MNPPAFDLSGKVALVTGAQRGIGAEVARVLAAAGADVIVGYVIEPERAEQLCREIIANGGKAYSTCFDVTDSAAVTRTFEKIAELYGRLDILVNNAGRRVDNLALKMSDEQWRQALAVNLDGVFYCCRAALALMRKTGGSIVNVSSIAAYTGSVGQANYAAAKAGIVGLTRSLALEYGSRGVRVNCVVPGIIETEMTADMKAAFRTELLERIPLRRFGEPADVAQAVLFLACDGAAYISGATLHINGGGYPS